MPHADASPLSTAPPMAKLRPELEEELLELACAEGLIDPEELELALERLEDATAHNVGLLLNRHDAFARAGAC